MIQPVASMLTTDLPKAGGKGTSPASNGAAIGSFSALLNENSDAPEAQQANPFAVETAASNQALSASAIVAGGKDGKETGKMLPGASDDSAASTEADSDSDAAADLSEADIAGLTLGLAGIMPFPATVQVQPAASGAENTPSSSAAAAQAGLSVQSRLTPRTTQTSASQAATMLAASIQPQAGAAMAGKNPAAAMTANSSAAEPVLDASVQAPVVTATKLAPIELVADTAKAAATLPGATAVAGEAASPISVQLAARSSEASKTEQPARGGDWRSGSRVPAEQGDAKLAASVQDVAAASQTPIRAQSDTSSMAAGLNLQPGGASAAPASTGTGAAASAKVDGPQDFATLVSRLAEAREAASPHIVRTAISHPEFGQIKMQFRHEDNAMAVTLANSDPAFSGAVQAAAKASMNGDAARDNAQQQQQQQSNGSSQQQSPATGGNAAGSFAGQQQQQQQARADQAGQSINRGQGSATRAGGQEASATGGSGDSSRQAGGIYA